MYFDIRAATESDLAGILRLYAQPEIDDCQTLGSKDARELFRRIESYPSYRIYVACLDGKIVGSFALLIMDNLGHLGAPSGIIEDVVVDPEWHRMGIGTAMMKYAMQKCRETGCYKITLSANRNREKAHRFYESLGFERHGYSYVVPLS